MSATDRTYEGELRVTVIGSDRTDARATLDEICTRLFGEECVVSISVPDSASLREVK